MTALATLMSLYDITPIRLAHELGYHIDQLRRMIRGDIPTPRVVMLATFQVLSSGEFDR